MLKRPFVWQCPSWISDTKVITMCSSSVSTNCPTHPRQKCCLDFNKIIDMNFLNLWQQLSTFISIGLLKTFYAQPTGHEKKTERGWFVQSALTDTDIPMLCWSLFCLFVFLHNGFKSTFKVLLTPRYGVWRSNVWAAEQLGTNHSTNIQTKAITHGTTL